MKSEQIKAKWMKPNKFAGKSNHANIIAAVYSNVHWSFWSYADELGIERSHLEEQRYRNIPFFIVNTGNATEDILSIISEAKKGLKKLEFDLEVEKNYLRMKITFISFLSRTMTLWTFS